MAGWGVGLGAFAQGFAGGIGLGQKFSEANQKRQDREAVEKINTDTRAAFDADVAAGKSTNDQWADYWTKTAGPQMVQSALARNEPEMATAYQKYVDTHQAKTIASNFGAALAATQTGDMGASIGAFDNYLKTTPFKGFVYNGVQQVAGPDGKQAWQATFRAPDGRSYSQSLSSPQDVERILTTYAFPEKAAELAMQRGQKQWMAQNGLGGDRWSPVSPEEAATLGVTGMPLQRSSTGKIEPIGGRAGAGPAPTVTDIYDPQTGQPQKAVVNTTTGAFTPIGGVKVPPKKPVPATIQNAEAEDLFGVQSVTTINDTLDKFSKQIDTKSLQLGPLSNFLSEAQNTTGLSNETSRNYASFKATLEKLRNDTLRLNKGVQTEGDAQRAWNELIKNINDPGVVKQRIAEIIRYNKAAAEYRRNVIQQRRADNGLEPLDIDRMVVPLPQEDDAAAGKGGAQAAGGSGGEKSGLKPGAVVNGFRFLGGDPKSRQSWERAQ